MKARKQEEGPAVILTTVPGPPREQGLTIRVTDRQPDPLAPGMGTAVAAACQSSREGKALGCLGTSSCFELCLSQMFPSGLRPGHAVSTPQ